MSTKKGRFTNKDQIVKRIDAITIHLLRLDAAFESLSALKAVAAKMGDRPERDRINELLRLNSQNAARAKGKLKKLSDKLATIQTPLLISTEGEDGSIPRK